MNKYYPPPVVLWENVPGVLNTKDNAFGCFLAGICGADFPLEIPHGRWPGAGIVAGPKRRVAWRTLDAQFFGVPQRRKRVFVIASADNRLDPSKILFERQGVRGNTETCESTRKNVAAYVESSFGTFCECDLGGTIRASGGSNGGGSETLILDISHRNDVVREYENTSPTLTARMGTGGNNVPCLLERSVRKLTPIECERLQGFPDDWTRINHKGKSKEFCPDGPRYKAVGNSWAVPVVRWIGERINNELNNR